MRDTEHKKTYFIGRAGDIRLDHTSASRHHACLDVSDSKLVLRDLASRNGTFEIRGEKPVPFAEGEVHVEQVFAFGICVRSIRQMLAEVGASGRWRASADVRDGKIQVLADAGADGMRTDSNPLDSEARICRIQTKLKALLIEAESDVAISDPDRPNVTTSSEEKPAPDFDSTDTFESISTLEQEIELLRGLLDTVSRERDAVQRVADLSLKRIDLQQSLIANIETAASETTPVAVPAEQGSEEGANVQTLHEEVDLTRRYFLPK